MCFWFLLKQGYPEQSSLTLHTELGASSSHSPSSLSGLIIAGWLQFVSLLDWGRSGGRNGGSFTVNSNVWHVASTHETLLQVGL